MPLPEPVPGLVIRYSYLWRAEHARGQDEGSKDRPSAVILVTKNEDGEQVVTVLPITHSPPPDPQFAVEIPLTTKQRLKMDDARSWIVLTEANRFVWPGPDLRPASGGDLSTVACGLLPAALYNQVLDKFIAAIKARKARLIQRTE